MKRRFRRVITHQIGLFALLLLGTLLVQPALAQDSRIRLSVEAGFESRFRDNDWMPVHVRVENDGDDVIGSLVVRPETSGEGVPNTFRVPVNLAGGARQMVPLYMTARGFASQIRVELIDSDGVVIASQPAALRALAPEDRLYVVLSSTPSGLLDLTGATFAREAAQANWLIEDLPDRPEAMYAVDLMLINDIDTSGITPAQRAALRDWVSQGGHLVVAGGSNWQATDLGVVDLLPLEPARSISVNSLAPLVDWLALPPVQADILASDAGIVVTVGDLKPGAQTLVSLDDGTPLIVRHTLGAGTVDFIAADPNAQPLRSWGRLPDLWIALQTTRAPQPGWSNGFSNWEQAIRASEILPGVDTLPDALPLLGFLALYIVLIGPLNYVILRRIDHLEWAWVTIPVCIIAFTAAAWALGYSLRGNDAILNRLAIVQSWPDADRARQDALTGVFSPRRTAYTLTAESGSALRPAPLSPQTGSLLTRSAAANVNIVQGQQFAAQDFSVDASFVATFALEGSGAVPPLEGSATLTYDPAIPGQMQVRGSVTNTGDDVLTDPVVLARGTSLHLGEPLQPGDILTFEMTLPGEGVASPSPYVPTRATPYLSFRQSSAVLQSEASVLDIIGPDRYDPDAAALFLGAGVDESLYRQQLLLWSVVDDPFGATGRGDSVYVAAWTEDAPVDVSLQGADWTDQRTTLAIARLETAVQPTSGVITISPDRFMWSVREYQGFGAQSPVDLNMQPGEAVSFRFTPLPGAVLDTVDELVLRFTDLNVSTRRIPVYLWNWRAEIWDEITVTREGFSTRDVQRYLGPENAVQVRMVADEIGGYLRIGRLDVEQTGRFNSR